jgi:hypothetical protein
LTNRWTPSSIGWSSVTPPRSKTQRLRISSFLTDSRSSSL